jgi:hypothetical protein
MSGRGPQGRLTRSVLIAVSLHMNRDGTRAWPTQELIAKRAGVGERTVRRHLKTAERDGWVERTLVRRGKGHAWYRTEYAACVPDDVYAGLPGQPATVASTHEDHRPITTAVPANGAQQPATQERVPARDDTDNRPQLGRLTLPLNSPSNPSGNSPWISALARTPFAKNGCSRVDEEGRKERIRRLIAAGHEDHHVAKLLRCIGVTAQEVQEARRAAGVEK